MLGLQTDVAGATLMALGSSAPELFISVIGEYRNVFVKISNGYGCCEIPSKYPHPRVIKLGIIVID